MKRYEKEENRGEGGDEGGEKRKEIGRYPAGFSPKHNIIKHK